MNIEYGLSFDDESIEIIERLKREEVFKKLNNSNLFGICLLKGKKVDLRTPLTNKKTQFVHYEALNNGYLPFLAMAIAVDTTKSLNILAKEEEYLGLCEEYAKSGLFILEREYVEYSWDIIDLLELESLEFFEDYIEPNLEIDDKCDEDV